MTTTPQQLNAITMFVEDLGRAKQFYQDGFGWTIAFEDEASVMFDAGGTIVNLLEEREAPGLIDPAAVAAPGSGQRFMLSIFVADVDAEIARLEGRGLRPINGPIDRPWGMRTACFTDPDGYIWELAQQIG